MNPKNSLFSSIVLIIIVLMIISFLINAVFNLLPFIILAAVIYYFYHRYQSKKENVKWHEGTPSDSYYEKVKRNEDVIDIKVNSRRIDDD